MSLAVYQVKMLEKQKKEKEFKDLNFKENKKSLTAKLKEAGLKESVYKKVASQYGKKNDNGDYALIDKVREALDNPDDNHELILHLADKKLFNENLASVMTAHMSIPKLEPNKKLPSSLSKRIVTDLLIDKMGFKGLIITDGLNMKGAADYSTSSEIDLAAILAGNDLLLIPQDIPATVKLFKKAIKEKKLSITRLNHSVRKILMSKYSQRFYQLISK